MPGVARSAAWPAVATPSLIANLRPGLAYYESSAFFPRIGLWLCVVSAVVVIGQAVAGVAFETSDEVDAEAARFGPAIIALALFVLYALALPLIGYALASALFAVATGVLVGLRWGPCLLVGIVAGAIGHVVFARLLGVAFPAPSLLGLG